MTLRTEISAACVDIQNSDERSESQKRVLFMLHRHFAPRAISIQYTRLLSSSLRSSHTLTSLGPAGREHVVLLGCNRLGLSGLGHSSGLRGG